MSKQMNGFGVSRYNPNGSPPRGEICIRGPLLFKEYYKDAKKTEEAMGASAVSTILSVIVTVLSVIVIMWNT